MFTMKEKKETRILIIIGILLLAVVCTVGRAKMSDAAGTVYKVKPTSKPYKNAYTKEVSYNKYTKQYYMLRSYLERLEKTGGGTLVLTKGIYKVTNTLYVPSNVTIQLNNGVTVRKDSKTGTSKLKASGSLFELIAPSKANKKESVKGYKGSKNIHFVGKGKSYINMNYFSEATGIVMGHNNNISISGIQFKNMMGGSFVLVGGSKKVTIEKCSFTSHKDKGGVVNRYAIRLEVPDRITKSFPYPWSMDDLTANQKIYIKQNTFNKLNSAIGSVKYSVAKGTSRNVYQKGIHITSNKFTDMDSHVIRILNWEKPIINSNTFTNIRGGKGKYKGVWISGAVYPTITGNTFDKVARPIEIEPAINSGSGKRYAKTFNTISTANAQAMSKNTVKNISEFFIRYNNGVSISRLIYYSDLVTKDYVLTETTGPFYDHYTDNSLYNQYTKGYFVFKSYLEQLELVGGGTLTIKKGTYSITNTVYVPSDVKIVFEDGVVINKGSYTGNASSPPSISMFQLVPPSKSLISRSVGGYNGSKNIQFIGLGTVIIDMKYFESMKAIVMGHNQNVTVQGITFLNMYGHHFIELNSTKGALIENCVFRGHKDSTNNNKEAINIDTPDANTGGFGQVWTNYDRSPVQDIIIRNNIFEDLERAVGTHKYSVTVDTQAQIYHSNIQILNNNFSNLDNDPIRALNWKNFTIQGNTFENVNNGEGTNRAILLNGVVNPTIIQNTFKKIARPIQANAVSNSGTGADSKYPMTYNTITETNLSDMLWGKNVLIDITETFIRIANGDKQTRYYYDEEFYSYTEK